MLHMRTASFSTLQTLSSVLVQCLISGDIWFFKIDFKKPFFFIKDNLTLFTKLSLGSFVLNNPERNVCSLSL